LRCARCALIHLHPDARLTPDQEIARYREHNNVVGDPEYEKFLDRLCTPLRERLPAGATGLDFGCGPARALESIMRGAGFATESYDPYFHPDDSLLTRRYDFVACSEVVEHLYDPAATFRLLDSLLVPGGVLGVMTRMYGHEAPFAEWWYRRDPTHVCFYNEDTMHWIAEKHGWSLELPRAHIAIFRKHP
jgi:SAM-dependent methyltransferase